MGYRSRSRSQMSMGGTRRRRRSEVSLLKMDANSSLKLPKGYKYRPRGRLPTFGSRAKVWHGNALKTTGGLFRRDLIKNKWGRIVSSKKHSRGKKLPASHPFRKYMARKGEFGTHMRFCKSNNIHRPWREGVRTKGSVRCKHPGGKTKMRRAFEKVLKSTSGGMGAEGPYSPDVF